MGRRHQIHMEKEGGLIREIQKTINVNYMYMLRLILK